jgi:predicted DCC family thiol-disulfide oxidoreductase YuxK
MSKSGKLPGIIIVYDGECPFCTDFVRLMTLRANVGPVSLVDARTSDEPIVRKLQDRGYNLDEGMVAIYGDAIYYGSEAVFVISGLSANTTWRGRMVSRLLRDPARARRAYPFLKFGRRVVLKLLGRQGIIPTSAKSPPRKSCVSSQAADKEHDGSGVKEGPG